MGNRVVMIGLDGGTLRILNPLMEAGKLPNISRLIQTGCHGVLLSTIPPVTAPAWTSLMTGKNPGKHGIFNFLRGISQTYTTTFFNWKESELVNALDIRSKTLWELVGEKGRQVGMVNMPMTYPPMPLNGFMVSCLLTPPGAKQFTYPPELAAEIPDYKIDIECGRGYGVVTPDYAKNADKFFSDLFDVLDNRGRSMLHLIKTRPWDLLMLVFTETDRLHHYFWRCMDYEDPFYNTPEGYAQRKLFNQLYERLDAYVGAIIEVVQGAIIMVISDHGFSTGAKKYFHLNSWLRQNGYLLMEGDPIPNSFTLEGPELISRFFRSRTVSLDFSGNRKGSVSWSQTRAWGIPFLARTGGIRINVKGEMEYGMIPRNGRLNRLIHRIKRGLEGLRDSGGHIIVEKVYLREDLYQGRFVFNAPDILFTVGPEYDIPLNFQMDIGSRDIITPIQNIFLTGNHDREGILIISGGPIAMNKRLSAVPIESIAPTILYLLDLPIPEDMDGTIIEDAMIKEYLDFHTVQHCTSELPNNRRGEQIGSGGWESRDGMEEVKARLRSLGYME